MHTTRRWCAKVTRVLWNGGVKDGASSRALLRRWREMRAAAPATVTGPSTALLAETVMHLESTAAAAASAPATEAGQRPGGATLLATTRNAELIWRVVQRQRVPWQAALPLLPWQLQTMSTAQRDFIAYGIAASPQALSRVVLTAGEVVDGVVDAALVRHYGALEGAAYMVEFARLVAAALRERPSLPGGLLPVPYPVMRHGYTLGRRTPQEAAMALALSAHLTLLGQSTLSRSAQEQLVLGHASLEGLVGNWAAALSVVTQSPAVRLSTRRGYARYVESLAKRETPPTNGRNSWAEETHPGGSGAENGTAAPASLRPLTLAKAADGVTAPHTSPWLSALRTFLAQPPDQQTYAEARSVLTALPSGRTQQPDHVVLAAAVLQAAAQRMYAGTLTRRLVSSARRADWSFALSLAVAARCYDVAVPLLPLLPSGTKLPADLHDYITAAQSIKTDGSLPSTASTGSLTKAAAKTLTYPQALAHALAGDASTRHVLLAHCPHTQSLSRLRSLLLAMRQNADAAATAPSVEGKRASAVADDAEGDSGDIDCCTFQSSSLSQLVCGAASAQRQRYFYRVLPATARAHHFRVSPLTTTPLEQQAGGCASHVASSTGEAAVDPARGATAEDSAGDALQRWRYRAATTPAACAALLRDLTAFLRATHVLEGVAVGGAGAPARPRLTEDVFLRSIASVTAWGTVQLPATERFHWPLAVLKAACLLRVPLDAALISAAARTVPSIFADHAALALPGILTAHTLLGNWQAALQVCARLQRKEREGLVQLGRPSDGKPRPQTDKYKAPPPSLREAMAQVGYGAPLQVALQHWTALDAPSVAPASAVTPTAADTSVFPLLLTELRKFKDARQLCEELHRNDAPTSRHTRTNARLERLSRRRMLFGAAFVLLDDEVVLQRVVRAGGQGRVRAEDLDCHGLQRVLGVLPAATVCRVLTAEAAAGRCAHEHWLLACIGHLALTGEGDAACRLAGLRPTSSALSAASRAHTALAEGNPVLCLKALRRMAEMALDSPARRALLLCIACVLRAFLSDDHLLQACRRRIPAPQEDAHVVGKSATAITAAARQQAQLLLNRLQEVEELSAVLKQARRVVRRTIDAPAVEAPPSPSQVRPLMLEGHATPCATWVLLAALHSAVSRALHLPIPAAFTSHLFFRSAAAATDDSPSPAVVDWRAALFLFSELRHPTDAERVALVRALRPCGGAATSILLSHRRFMRHRPELLLLWADEATGPAKWAHTIALLTEADTADAPLRETDEHNEAVQRRAKRASSSGVLSPYVQAAVQRWNADECFRAAQLLKRQGFVRIPATPARSLRRVQILEADPNARRQVEAILQLLRKGTASAEAAATTPPPPPGQRLVKVGDH